MNYIPTVIHLIFIHIPFLQDYYYDYVERSYIYNKQELARVKSWWARYQSIIIEQSISPVDAISFNALFTLSNLTELLKHLHNAVNILENRLKHPIVIENTSITYDMMSHSVHSQ